MKCKSCGQNNPENAVFCQFCGTKLEREVKKQEKMPVSEKKTGLKSKWIILGVVAFVLVVGIAAVVLTAPGRKLAKYQKEYNGLDQRFDPYLIDKSDQQVYDEQKEEFGDALAAEDLDRCKVASNKFGLMETDLKSTVEKKLRVLASTIDSLNESDLCDVEVKDIASYRSKASAALAKKDYQTAAKNYKECQKIMDAAMAASNYSMELRQIDVTNFPSVRLYLSITDLTTGKSIDDLKEGGFSLKERISKKTGYQDIKIKSVGQMNQKAGLNTGIVADVSGSMGSNLGIAQNAMSNFVSSMQFNVNDKAALYSFSDYVKQEQFFTSNEGALKNAINNLYSGDMTALYDALVYSISDIVVEDGAKCVIAFTDGMENASHSSKEYVIEKAKQYDIPIYIIGIGSGVDTSALQDITNQTGGKYWNISNVASMDQVYQEIYQTQKSMYVLEYTTQMKKKADLMREIYIRFSSNKYYVRSAESYNPANYKIDGFIFYDSNARYLTEAELRNLSEEEVLIALNELYARRGYEFQTNLFLKDHFNKCSWYKKAEKDQAVVERQFNKYEVANKDMLVKYEKEHQLNNRKK